MSTIAADIVLEYQRISETLEALGQMRPLVSIIGQQQISQHTCSPSSHCEVSRSS